MKQECGWFDEDDHSSAALSARLTGDAGNLQSVSSNLIEIFKPLKQSFPLPFKMAVSTSLKLLFQVIGFPLSILFQTISTLTISLTLSMFYSWKLSLLCLTGLPMTLAIAVIESK